MSDARVMDRCAAFYGVCYCRRFWGHPNPKRDLCRYEIIRDHRGPLDDQGRHHLS